MSESQLVCRLPITESFSPEYLEYYRLLPLDLTEQSLRVAVAGEPHDEALEDLRTSYGVPLEVIAVTADELQAAIRQTFAAAEPVVELVRDLSADLTLETDRADEAATDMRDLANQPPVIRFANLLICEAQLLLDPPETSREQFWAGPSITTWNIRSNSSPLPSHCNTSLARTCLAAAREPRLSRNHSC